MKSLLSSSEMKDLWENYQALIPMVGSQTHHNHDHCSAGMDTKKRLYLKRTSEGMVAYCHHCGKGGFLRTTREPRRLEMLLEEKLKEKPKGNPFPAYELVNFPEWPTEPKLWWLSHEMSEADAVVYGVGWHNNSSRLVLWSPALLQGRGFYGVRPKYITYQHTNDVSCLISAGSSNALFFCEDLVSAYKLHKADASVCALTGTKFNSQHLTLASRFDKVVLWLDSDVAGALGGAEMYKELSALTAVINLSSKPLEPKETPLTELKNIVDYYNA